MLTKNNLVLFILCFIGTLYFCTATIPDVLGQTVSAGISPVPDVPWAQQLERLGLVGSLLITVWVLWGSYQKLLDKKDLEVAKKDEVLMTLVTKVTESMGAFQEFRRSVETSAHVNEEMSEELRKLQTQITKLPCTVK